MPLPDNTLPLGQAIIDEGQQAYVAATLQNAGESGQGTVLPDSQQGDYTIPFPQGFTASAGTASFGGNIFTLTWLDIDPSQADVAGYRIYVKQQFSNQTQQVQIGTSRQSPCVVRVISDSAQTITFTLQPFLINGQTLPIEACPTCTGSTPSPVFSFTSGTVTAKIDSNLPSGTGGSPVTGFNVHDTTPDSQVTLASTGLICINGNGQTTAAMATINPAVAGTGGVVRCFNGSGTGKISNSGQTIRLNGDNSGNGKIDVFGEIALLSAFSGDTVTFKSGFAASASVGTVFILPTTCEGFLNISVGGVDYKIPYFPV